MTKEEAIEFIEERKQLEYKINTLRVKKLVDMNLFEVFDKLALLKQLYAEHRQLSEKIKMIERTVKI